MLSRREFLFSAGAAALYFGVAPRRAFAARPELKFGVISDAHLTTKRSCVVLEKAFRFFLESGVDAVVITGDISDYGTRTGWRLMRDTWLAVFGGMQVVPLFCTGNHDIDGWRYNDMAMDMFVNGQDGADRIRHETAGEIWREVFNEDFAPIRLRSVKGYNFVSTEFGHERELAAWMAENGVALAGGKPFFYFQHLPIKGTTFESDGWADNGAAKPVLEKFPNCVAFTGHTHRPFYDERSICQGAFTSIVVPSLSYARTSDECENGKDSRDGRSKKAMPMQPSRRDLRGGLGYLVNVYEDCIVFERHDFVLGEKTAADWSVPLPMVVGQAPYEYARRTESAPTPEFPLYAEVDVATTNTENRKGAYIIAMDCRFPSATVQGGLRVRDYELRVVTADGSVALTKRFLSPAFVEPEYREPKMLRFWFDSAELPKGVDFWIEIAARNSFGRCGRAIRSERLHAVKPVQLD